MHVEKNEIKRDMYLDAEWRKQVSHLLVLKPLDNIGKTEKQKCSQIYT